MQVKDIIQAIEAIAPPQYQESYDNCGLQIGNEKDEVKGVLISLDVTEAILEEAQQRGCNMIVSHHPVLFTGLKKITDNNYVERIVRKAIKHDISIFSAHTNLDNIVNGVNSRIASKLGLKDTMVLVPKKNTLSKLFTYAPHEAVSIIKDALFAAGAGNIGKYKECSFSTEGTGTFRASSDANPTIGIAGGHRETVDEVKIEVIVPKHKEKAVLKALFESHPYEEVAYEFVQIPNENQDIGEGLIGILPIPIPEVDFLTFLKRQMKTGCIRHTALRGKRIEKVALCGGSGSTLLDAAIAANADIFITGDVKYHRFFDAENRILIADIGHYESEQFTTEIFESVLTKKFPNFAVLLSKLNTNPVQYFC